jgi:hypothetical protein
MLTIGSSFVDVELDALLFDAYAIEVLDMHLVDDVHWRAVRSVGVISRVICRDILQMFTWGRERRGMATPRI